MFNRHKVFLFRILWILCVAAVSSVLAFWLYRESLRVEVRHVWVKARLMENVPKNFTVVQLSDLHIGQSGGRTQAVLTNLDSLKPDIIVLTGDYVSWNGDYEVALNFLSRLKAKVGVYAVMGDYDYSNSRKSCLFCHVHGSGKSSTHHSAKFLRDSCDEVAIGTDSIRLCGIDGRQVDDPISHNVVRYLRGLKKNKMAIVLSHNPLAFDLFDQDEDVLILSGDTHGGQIPLPAWLWRTLGYEKMKYEQGWFEKGKKKMYVSRGVGTSHFPIRFMRPPEITVFHFQSTENEVH